MALRLGIDAGRCQGFDEMPWPPCDVAAGILPAVEPGILPGGIDLRLVIMLEASNVGPGAQSGQAPARTPARLEARDGSLLSGQHAPAEPHAEAGTIAAKVTGALSQPLTIWLTRTNTFMSVAGALYRAV